MKKQLLFIAMFFISIALSAQWTQQNTNMTGTYPPVGVDQISVVNANVVWVNGFNGGDGYKQLKAMSRTANGGTAWTAGAYAGFGATVYPQVLAGASATKACCIAYDTAASKTSFWKTSDGTNWTQFTTMFANSASFADGVRFWNNGKGFCFGDAVNNNFEIYTTADSGATWTAVDTAHIQNTAGDASYNGSEIATAISGGFGCFLTYLGNVMKTTDYGANWTITAAKPFTSVDYGGKIYASSANYIIAGNSSSTGVYTWMYTTNGGTSWNAFAPSAPFYQEGMCYVPGTTNTFIATGAATALKGIALSTNGGLAWTDFPKNKLLQYSGANIQCLAVGFFDGSTGWVGNYDTTGATSSILKYSDPGTTVGLYTYVESNDLNIYPSPSTGLVHFDMNGPSTADVAIKVFDVTGNMVFEKVLNINGTSSATYDFSNLSKGMYIVNISSANSQFNKKLIIN